MSATEPAPRLNTCVAAFEEADNYVAIALGLVSLGRRLQCPSPGAATTPGNDELATIALGVISISRCLERLLLANAPLAGPVARLESHDDLEPTRSRSFFR